jgi:hypothetical protein
VLGQQADLAAREAPGVPDAQARAGDQLDRIPVELQRVSAPMVSGGIEYSRPSYATRARAVTTTGIVSA